MPTPESLPVNDIGRIRRMLQTDCRFLWLLHQYASRRSPAHLGDVSHQAHRHQTGAASAARRRTGSLVGDAE